MCDNGTTPCQLCGTPLPSQEGKPGRKRLFCCDECKLVASILDRLEGNERDPEGIYSRIVARAKAAGKPEKITMLRAQLFRLLNDHSDRDPETGRFIPSKDAQDDAQDKG